MDKIVVPGARYGTQSDGLTKGISTDPFCYHPSRKRDPRSYIMSDKSQTVIVPVLVSGYINYANAEYKTFGNKSSTVTTTRAYFAQSPGADASSASLEDGPIQHDIFESIRSAPYGAGGDPYRSTDERSGIYLHWSLPKFLRTGIVGSETSDKSVNQG